MTTVVLPERECASACVFILMAGVTRIPTNLAHVELHRPRFDPVYFANLTAQQASTKYNTLVEELRKHFIDEMGGSEQTFRLMMSTPSDELQTLIVAELEEFGLRAKIPLGRNTSTHKMSSTTDQSGGRS